MPKTTYLSQTDTLMWMVEADPLLRSTILGVVLLEAAPDWQRLHHRIEEVTHQVPALREKVTPVPLHPTLLRWEPDPAFDLNYHLRRISLPPGSGVPELLDWARSTYAGGFDSSRPLWEFTLVEGVSHDGHPDGAAMILQRSGDDLARARTAFVHQHHRLHAGEAGAAARRIFMKRTVAKLFIDGI